MRYAVLFALALASVQSVGARTVAPLVVSSPDLPAGREIALQFTGRDFGCTGGEISPALVWSGAPAGTKSYLITMFDGFTPPQSGWWHWIMADVPAATSALAQGAGNPGGALPAGAHMVRPDGDAPQERYYGPCPDKGDPTHHYVITVYALDVATLGLPATASAADYDYAAIAHTLARGSIVRDYTRP